MHVQPAVGIAILSSKVSVAHHSLCVVRQRAAYISYLSANITGIHTSICLRIFNCDYTGHHFLIWYLNLYACCFWNTYVRRDRSRTNARLSSDSIF